MKKYYVLFILIFLFGAILRFYHLGNVPVGFHRDEAFLGYNAYSLLRTGRDMTGNILPLHLQSFLYSPAGYSYFSIPFIAFFGLSVFSVRFAAAFFGSFTLLLVPLLVSEVFYKRKDKFIIAVFSEFFLSITPWHINLSRVATENVLVVFFITLGIYLYLVWLRKNNLLFFACAFVSFGLTLLLYQAPRAFLPLLLPCLFIYAIKKIKSKEMLLSVTAYVLIIITPVLIILHSPELSTRIHMLSIFQDPQTQLVVNEHIREEGVLQIAPFVTRLFENKVSGYATTFLSNYFQHFSYQFLFTDAGLPDRYRVPGMGLLYLFDIVLLPLGIWYVLKKELRAGLFLIAWVLLAPIGSALTYDDIPNLQRTLFVFPALSIIAACGGYMLFDVCKNQIVKRSVYIVGAGILLYAILFYCNAYYVLQTVHRPWFREEGFAKLVPAVSSLLPQYKYALISNQQSDPAILFLFYTKFDPEMFQILYAQHPTTLYGNFSYGKYHFPRNDCPLDTTLQTDQITGQTIATVQGDPDILYVDGGACKLPKDHIQLLRTIRRNDGTPVFFILRFIQYNSSHT